MLVLIILATACRKDREYYIIDLKNPGQIIIPDDIDLPVEIILIDEGDNDGDGDEEETEVDPGDEIDVESGRYKLVVMKNTTGITRKDVVASMAASGGGELAQAPNLLADVVIVIVEPDKITIPTINLKPMTREVHIRLAIEGVTHANITSVKATLNGVANAVNMEQGFGSVTGNAAHYITAQTTGYAPTNVMPLRIFGLTPGAKPTISIEVTTTKGDVHSLELDVTQTLAAFGTGNPTDPVLLQVDMTVKTGVGTTGTIKPWMPGWQGEIEATE